MRGKNRSLGGRGGRPCFSVGVAGGGTTNGGGRMERERRRIGSSGARILEDLNARSNEGWPSISRRSGGGRLEIC